jgi:hypothetical protein
MIIYLVSGSEYEDRYICAAFTSLEEAEKYVDEKNAENIAKSKWPDPRFYRLAEEVELSGVDASVNK